MANRDWLPIIDQARVVAEEVIEQIGGVSLRQIHYRIRGHAGYRNTKGDYNALSTKTAALRRKNEFPALVESGRKMYFPGWTDADHLLGTFAEHLRLHRDANQDHQIVLGCEKEGLIGLMTNWFGEFGLPIVPLAGYSSETVERSVIDHVERESDERPAVLILVGDFDASGMDISRNFQKQTARVWENRVHRVALNIDQVEDLISSEGEDIVMVGKCRDARAPGFIERHRELHERFPFTGKCESPSCRAGEQSRADHGPDNLAPIQIEIESVPPLVLHDAIHDAINLYWDEDAYDEQLSTEVSERARITRALELLREEESA